MSATLLESLAQQLNDNSSAIDIAIDAINHKIDSNNVEPDKVYFFDNSGNKIFEGTSLHTLLIPKTTAMIVANGDLNLDGDLENKMQIFAKGNVHLVPQENKATYADIKAGGEVYIKASHWGEICSVGEVHIEGEQFKSVRSNSDVKIGLSSHADIISGGNVIVGSSEHKGSAMGRVEANVIAKGGIAANVVAKTAELHAGGEVHTGINLGKIIGNGEAEPNGRGSLVGVSSSDNSLHRN